MTERIDIRTYLQHTIIGRLERLMDGGSAVDAAQDGETYPYGAIDRKSEQYQVALHELMVPYYDMYLNGDFRLCKPNMEAIRWRMKDVIEEDEQFGTWASEQDLIVSAEGWGKNMQRIQETKRIYQYFYVLQLLLEKDCRQDWQALSLELKEMLFKAEAYSDYKTDEVLCVLHGFTMIMQQAWTKERKVEMLELLRTNWLFLKHYYSVMTRHIIGVKWTKLSKVAETVMTASQSFKPHMHIFYCGLMDCVDELNLDRRHRREMDKICLQMQEELNRCEPSELLYDLCDTLFPEDFQRLLREHRPKSYREVEDENHEKDELIEQMRVQTKHMHEQLSKTQELLQQMVLSAIPIEDVDKELMKYPPGMAWDMLRDLNANVLVNVQRAWRENYPALLEKHRQRLFEPINQQKDLTEAVRMAANKPTNHFTVYPQADSTTNIGCDQKGSDFKTYMSGTAVPDKHPTLKDEKGHQPDGLLE